MFAARTGLFFFNDTATTEIYTLSLHDALPISESALVIFDIGFFLLLDRIKRQHQLVIGIAHFVLHDGFPVRRECVKTSRSEEHTSELQSRLHLVCRLLLEKKKKSLSLMSLRVG